MNQLELDSPPHRYMYNMYMFTILYVRMLI